MFFFILPVGVDYRARRYPVVTFTLMGLNVLVYLITLLLTLNGGKETQEWILQHLWLTPANSPWYTYVTTLFVHEGFFHLAGNMVYLFLFGACVEDLLGRVKFSVFYLLGGLAADFGHIAASPAHFAATIPLGGASGAITACIGAFVLLLARTQIEFKWVFFLLFRIWSGDFFLPAWIVISAWFLKDLAMAGLTLAGGAEGGGVAFAAHVGGFLWGLAAVGLLKLTEKREPEGELAQTLTLPRPAFAAAAAEAASIYLFADGTQSGPFTPTQIEEMLRLGSIPADANYWQEGMPDWASVAELQNALGAG